MLRKKNRGFTLLSVVLILSVVTISAMVVLDTLGVDFGLLRAERQTQEARVAAEGGLMELVNDYAVMGTMPDLTTPNLRLVRTPSANSQFVGEGRDYQARIDLVRIAPMMESSHQIVRAVIYEVNVEGQAGDGANARVQAEVFRVAAVRSGIVQPDLHAR